MYINKKLKDNIKVLLFVCIFIFSFFNLMYSFAAEDIESLKSQINDRNSEIKKLQAEIDAYNSKVATTQQEAKDLKSAIAKLESQKKDLLNQISLTNLKIKNTEGDINMTLNKISENQTVIDKNRQALAKSLAELKKNDDNSSFILNLIGGKKNNFSDILNEATKLATFNISINEKIDNINGAIRNLNDNKSEYEKQKNTLTDLSRDLSSRENLVAQNQKDKNTLLNETKNKEKTYQQIIKDRQQKVEDLEEEINSFESKIKYILDKSKLPTSGTGLSYPVKKVIITQYFGDTEFSRTGAYNGHGHNGIDFGVSVGTPVYAAASGVVMGTGNTDTACPRASYGKWILIKHNNGLATLYGHMSTINVVAGQSVNALDQIGLSGNTGYSTGPHLHFTVIAADAVRIFGPKEYKSRTCGTYMVMPYAPLNAYLNPLSYLRN